MVSSDNVLESTSQRGIKDKVPEGNCKSLAGLKNLIILEETGLIFSHEITTGAENMLLWFLPSMTTPKPCV
jgi:hypothetical protein